MAPHRRVSLSNFFDTAKVPTDDMPTYEEDSARRAHEGIRLLHIAAGWKPLPPDWLSLTPEEKKKAVDKAHYALLNPFKDSVQIHDEWCAQREAEGWRRGDRYDEDLKTHPDLVHYNDLPVERQLKDRMFQLFVLGY